MFAQNSRKCRDSKGINVRQEQMQALKQIPKQDYEVDLIDNNRPTLIDQERVQIFSFYLIKKLNKFSI
jgi:hypothetical protein